MLGKVLSVLPRETIIIDVPLDSVFVGVLHNEGGALLEGNVGISTESRSVIPGILVETTVEAGVEIVEHKSGSTPVVVHDASEASRLELRDHHERVSPSYVVT